MISASGNDGSGSKDESPAGSSVCSIQPFSEVHGNETSPWNPYRARNFWIQFNSPVTMRPKTLSSKVMAMTLSEDTLFKGFSCSTEAFHESSLHLIAGQCAPVDTISSPALTMCSRANSLRDSVCRVIRIALLYQLVHKGMTLCETCLACPELTIAPFCGLLESAQIPSTQRR